MTAPLARWIIPSVSPNYALAHYALAFVHCQTGDPARAIDAADTANRLSPLDPMLFAMHGTRTFALLRLGKVQEAADFAIRAGQQPNADVHAHAIAALTLATAGRIEEAHAERGRINTLRPDYNFKHFKNAFHLLDDLKDLPKGREVSANPRMNATKEGHRPHAAERNVQ
jgi:tetratricopeptide (TPR) repeat protein